MKRIRARRIWLPMVLAVSLLWSCLFVMSGCQHQEMLLTKVELDSAPAAVKTFINRIEQMNGIYLYTSDSADSYLFLNSYWVTQGEPAVFFTDVAAEVEGNELLIHVTDQSTRDYAGAKNSKVLYRIAAKQGYDTILLFRNMGQTAFTAIGN